MSALIIRKATSMKRVLPLLAAAAGLLLMAAAQAAAPGIAGPTFNLTAQPAYMSQPDGQSVYSCLLYTSPSPRDGLLSRMPSSA